MILYMTRGVPGCGKTTWAKKLSFDKGVKRVNRDDLRAMIDDSCWSQENEKNITYLRDFMITHWLYEGHDVVVDDTNLTLYHYNHIKFLANRYAAEFKVVDFDTPLDECIRRDFLRENPVGYDRITKMNKTLQSTLKTLQDEHKDA